VSIQLTRLIHKNNHYEQHSLNAIISFLAITFIQSGYDKIFYWKDNVSWLKEHFSKTPLKIKSH